MERDVDGRRPDDRVAERSIDGRVVRFSHVRLQRDCGGQESGKAKAIAQYWTSGGEFGEPPPEPEFTELSIAETYGWTLDVIRNLDPYDHACAVMRINAKSLADQHRQAEHKYQEAIQAEIARRGAK